MGLHPEDIIRVYIGQEVLSPDKRTAIPTDKFNHTIEIEDHQLHLSAKGAGPFSGSYIATELDIGRFFHILPIYRNCIT